MGKAIVDPNKKKPRQRKFGTEEDEALDTQARAPFPREVKSSPSRTKTTGKVKGDWQSDTDDLNKIRRAARRRLGYG